MLEAELRGGGLGGGAGGLAQGLNFFTFATDVFFTALNTLAADSKVNILSSPSILTTENKKAVINVSRSIPIVTAQQVPIAGVTTPGTTPTTTPTAVGTQTIEYKDAGVILTVTPRIGEKGTVALDVKQEVNEVGPIITPPGSPSFTKREAETSAVLTNNQTLALGGLIQNKRTLTRSGIPLLNRIPLLGLLFGNTEERVEKTELLILITPRVLGASLDFRQAHGGDEADHPGDPGVQPAGAATALSPPSLALTISPSSPRTTHQGLQIFPLTSPSSQPIFRHARSG